VIERVGVVADIDDARVERANGHGDSVT
jgi:hypothetical protein